ncbi:hypothetical protein GY45DRAFT_1434583 [Cubamyces sp. BRFM 1775]|nr:hypothetical protein GY45DRAFT_1434583 [Cubamyces sp. BRFM 1775]
MPSPPIQVFLTTIASQPALRQRQDKQQLPGILIGGEFPGTFQDFEEAVEFGELDTFLRLNEEWQPLEDEKPMLRAVPVGIPGAYSPAQMNPDHISPAPSPIKTKSREGEIDAGDRLGDSGLHGVNVTEDDLLALVEELGLGEADAEELVKGLGGGSKSAPPPEESKPKPEVKKEEAASKDENKQEEPAPVEKTEEPKAEESKKTEDAAQESEKPSTETKEA